MNIIAEGDGVSFKGRFPPRNWLLKNEKSFQTELTAPACTENFFKLTVKYKQNPI